MPKHVVLEKEAKKRLLKGVHTVAKAVTATMGIGGRNVVFEDEYGSIRSTKDGVTVAKNINSLEDPIEDFGARLIKEAAVNTADVAGDGTTTSTLLTSYIAEKSIEAIEKGFNAVELKKGIDKGYEYVVKELDTFTIEINNESDLKKIATLSANGDEQIGELISSAIIKAGSDGVVTVEDSRYGDTRMETVVGVQFSKGLLSPYFANDDKNSKCTLDTYGDGNVKILLYDGVIGFKEQVAPILEYCLDKNIQLLIIAEDIVGEAIPMFIINKERNGIKVCPVKADQYGDKRKAFIEDIAIISGGTVISPDKGLDLRKFSKDYTQLENYLGEARRIEVKTNTTTIIDAQSDKTYVENRVKEIQYKLENSQSQYETQYYKDRLGSLFGSVTIVHVSGLTKVELKERKDRAEDALFATYCALSDGVISGGGVPLLLIKDRYYTNRNLSFKNKHEEEGFKILLDACEQPFIKILYNAGIDLYPQLNLITLFKEWFKGNIKNLLINDLNKYNGKYIYHPLTKEYIDAYESGILDPVKVTKTALQNAVSVAGTILLTEAVIYTEKQETQVPNYLNELM